LYWCRTAILTLSKAALADMLRARQPAPLSGPWAFTLVAVLIVVIITVAVTTAVVTMLPLLFLLSLLLLLLLRIPLIVVS